MEFLLDVYADISVDQWSRPNTVHVHWNSGTYILTLGVFNARTSYLYSYNYRFCGVIPS